MRRTMPRRKPSPSTTIARLRPRRCSVTRLTVRTQPRRPVPLWPESANAVKSWVPEMDAAAAVIAVASSRNGTCQVRSASHGASVVTMPIR